MKISVVTVALNAVQTIAATLDSVAAQTYPDIEHILVDGASKDGTMDVIRRHGKHVAQLISEPDRGIYDAMNKGISMASGEVVGFLNAGDVYADNDVLREVIGYMRDEELDAVFGDVVFFSPNRPTRNIRRYRSSRFSPNRIAWGWMPAHSALFLKKRVFQRFGLFKTDYKIAGDFELVARMFYRNSLKYCYIPKVLVRMQIGGISTAGWRSTILLNREVLRACRENGIKTNLAKILSKYPQKLLEFFHL